jgi:hypothetical protein
MRLSSLILVDSFLFAAGLPVLAANSSVDASHVQAQLMVLHQGSDRAEAVNVRKRSISRPLFAAVVWMAWVLAQADGADVLTALLASLLVLDVAGWLPGRWPVRRWFETVASLIRLEATGVSVAVSGKLLVVWGSPAATTTHNGRDRHGRLPVALA